MAMVGVVLLIASANVAMLLLLRNASKRREFALRRALGANARVLFGQLISESLLLVTAGCLPAWLVASQATEMLIRWSGLGFPIALDHQVLLFTIAVSALVALAFGLISMRGEQPSACCNVEDFGCNGERPGQQILRPQAGCERTDLALYSSALRGTVAVRHLAQSGICRIWACARRAFWCSASHRNPMRTATEAVRFQLRILNGLRALPGVVFRRLPACRQKYGRPYPPPTFDA